jgi:hypothetical protein
MANGYNQQPDPTQAMQANLRFMRENGYSEQEIKQEEQRWQAKISEYNKRGLAGAAISAARGIPGGEAAFALGRQIKKKVTGQPETFAESRKAVREIGEEFATESPRLSTGLGLATGAVALTGPLGVAERAMTPVIASRALRGAISGGGTAATYRALDAAPEEGATMGEKIASRAKGTAMAAGLGGVAGAVAPWLMTSQSIPAMAGRTVVGGLIGGAVAPEGYGVPGAVAGGGAMIRPDVTARMAAAGVEKVAGRLPQKVSDFMQAIGPAGIVNREMQQMQSVMTPLGGRVGAPSDAAAQNIARAEALRRRSNDLFKKARADRRIIDTPEIQELLDDPDVSAAFEMAKEIRRAYGGRVPTVTELRSVFGPAAPTEVAPVGTAQSPAPSVREAIDAFRTRLGQSVTRKEGTVMQQTAREGVERQAAMREGFPITGERTMLPVGVEPLPPVPVTREVPDPELLHLTKRILNDVKTRAFGRDVTVQLQDGLRVAPKLDRLRNILHSESKDYAAADRAMRLAAVANEAFDMGFTSATSGATRPTAKKLAESTIAAVKAFVEEQPDDEMRRVAEAAAIRGARAQMLQQITGRELTAGVPGMLSAPSLAASPEARQQRGFALGSQAKSFEDLLSGLRGENVAEAGRGRFRRIFDAALTQNAPGSREGAQQLMAGGFAGTPEQTRLIGEILNNPEAYQGVLQQYQRGAPSREALMNALVGVSGMQASRLTGQRRRRAGYDIYPNQ